MPHLWVLMAAMWQEAAGRYPILGRCTMLKALVLMIAIHPRGEKMNFKKACGIKVQLPVAKIKFPGAIAWTALAITTLAGSTLLTSCSGGNVVGMAGDYNDKAKTFTVIANMKVVQNNAEKYMRDHGYMYPMQIDDEFKSYFEGGDTAAKKPGNAPINPFTGSGEWPVLGSLTDVPKVKADPPVMLPKGQIEYSPMEGGKAYAVRGGDEHGMTLVDAETKQVIVLTRDNFKSADSAAPSK